MEAYEFVRGEVEGVGIEIGWYYESSSKHLPHFARKVLKGEGFGDEVGSRVKHSLMNDSILAETCGEQDFEVRPPLQRLIGELASIDIRHHDIRKKEGNVVSIRSAPQVQGQIPGLAQAA
jgi:hypothetical protein